MHLLTELPTEPSLVQIMAPVTGRVSPIESELSAIHQLALLGKGVICTPNTPRICAPARCKITQVSPDRRVWTMAIPGRLRLRFEIVTHTMCPLPLALSNAKVGDVCDTGTPVCVLSAQCMQHQPKLILTVTAADAEIGLLPHYGRAMVTQDAILSIYPWVEPTAPEKEETL